MKTGKYELVVVWSDGEKTINEYESKAEAKQAEQGYKTVFGNQVSWSCVRDQIAACP